MLCSKKCTICQSSASIFCSSIISKTIKHSYFCKEHALKSGILDAHAYSLLDFEKESISQVNFLFCAQCQTSFEMVKKYNRFGCPNCYLVFCDYLENVINKMHKSDFHLGKIPTKGIDLEDAEKRVHFLEFELDLLVKKEQFEDAAHIRDYIMGFKHLIKSLAAKKR